MTTEALAELHPLIAEVVAEVLAQAEAERQPLNGRLAFTEAEAAQLLGMERHALRDARYRGEIVASKLGSRKNYSREELVAYLERQKQ